MISFLIRVARERGLKFFYDYFVEAILFDILRRTDTAMRVTKDNQWSSVEDNEFNDGLLYVASFTSVIKKTVGLVNKHCQETSRQVECFVDLGCGKGKTLMVVHELYSDAFPSGIIGIEYDRNLVAIGQKNLKICKLAEKVTIVRDTAVNVGQYITNVPPLIYLYNSFQGETLQAVLGELSSFEHFLVYVDPVEAELLTQRNYMELYSNEGRYNADSWKIFHYGVNAG